MEKSILIDGRLVSFKTSGAFLMRYKSQFQRDALKDIVKLYPLISRYEALKDADEAQAIELIEGLDLQLFYNFAWVLAKTADPSIPDPFNWLDSFSTFPIMEVTVEIQELLALSIGVSKKN